MSVDIVVPTFNRKRFEKLISYNITCQTYPCINSVLVGDDGCDEQLDLQIPYTVAYYTMDRCSIGAKRNFLVSQSTADYVCFMDTDDLYHPDYISNSIWNLLTSGKSVSGSSDMLLTKNGKDVYLQRCIYMDLLNEATLVFKRSFFDTHKFANTMSSEGSTFLKDAISDIIETPIEEIMICICHDANTVPKEVWLNQDAIAPVNMEVYTTHLNIYTNL